MDLKNFENYLFEQDRAVLTVRGYSSDLRTFFQYLASRQTKPEELEAADVRAFRQHLLDHGFAAQTINRKLAAIAAFGNWAVQAGIFNRNPALHIKSVESAPLGPKWLDKKQKAALIRAIYSDLKVSRQRFPRLWVLRLRDAVSVILLLNTGLRVGELCALRLNDILLTERKAALTIRSGKGTKQRIVPLNGDARRIVEEWLSVRPEVKVDALFVGQRGDLIKARSVQNAVLRLAKEAGLSGVTPHVCRHTFAKSLLDSGVSMEKVAALLGHESLDTTRLYVTPGERDLELAVGALVE